MDLRATYLRDDNLQTALNLGWMPTVENLAVLAFHEEYKNSPAYKALRVQGIVGDVGNMLMHDIQQATGLPRGRNDAANVAVAVRCHGMKVTKDSALGSEYQVTGGDESSGSLYVTKEDINERLRAIVAAYNIDVGNLGYSNPILSIEGEKEFKPGESFKGRNRTDGLMQRHTQFLRACFRKFSGQVSTYQSDTLPIPDVVKNTTWDGSPEHLEEFRKVTLSSILASNLRNGAACFLHPKSEYQSEGLTGQGSVPGIQIAEPGTTLETLEQSVKKGKQPLAEGGMMLSAEDRRKLFNGEALMLPDGTPFTLQASDPFYKYIQSLSEEKKEELIQHGIKPGDLPKKYIKANFPEAENLPSYENAQELPAINRISPDTPTIKKGPSDLQRWGRVFSELIKQNYEAQAHGNAHFSGSPFEKRSEFNNFLSDFGQLAALVYPLNKHLTFAEDMVHDSQQLIQNDDIAYGFAKVYGFGNTNKSFGLEKTDMLRDTLVTLYKAAFVQSLAKQGVDHADEHITFYDRAGNRSEEAATFTFRLALPKETLKESDLNIEEITYNATHYAQSEVNKLVELFGLHKTPAAKDGGLPGVGIVSTAEFLSRSFYNTIKDAFDGPIHRAFDKIEKLEKANYCLNKAHYFGPAYSDLLQRPNNKLLSNRDISGSQEQLTLSLDLLEKRQEEKSQEAVPPEEKNVFLKLLQSSYEETLLANPMYKNAIAGNPQQVALAGGAYR